MKWRFEGSIAGMKCTQIAAPDDYLCVPQNSPLNFQWSSSGPIEGTFCIQWLDVPDQDASDDNYLCAEKCELGFYGNGQSGGAQAAGQGSTTFTGWTSGGGSGMK